MSSLRFNLGHQKVQLIYLQTFLDDVREKRYQPFYDDGPSNYDPLKTTYLDVERDIFEDVENAEALYHFERFKNRQSRLHLLCHYIESQMAFDYTYRDDLREPLEKIPANHAKFQALHKEIRGMGDLYHSHWQWLETQGRLFGYETARRNYKDTFAKYQQLLRLEFEDVSKDDTPQSLFGVFKIYEREELKDSVQAIQIDLDRAMFLSKQMRFMARCMSDGVLENDTEGMNFIGWSKRQLGSLLPSVEKEIKALEHVLNYGVRPDFVVKAPQFQLLGPA